MYCYTVHEFSLSFLSKLFIVKDEDDDNGEVDGNDNDNYDRKRVAFLDSNMVV
jgi:hypothetical protein